MSLYDTFFSILIFMRKKLTHSGFLPYLFAFSLLTSTGICKSHSYYVSQVNLLSTQYQHELIELAIPDYHLSSFFPNISDVFQAFSSVSAPASNIFRVKKLDSYSIECKLILLISELHFSTNSTLLSFLQTLKYQFSSDEPLIC
jgi:hypothetical protein